MTVLIGDVKDIGWKPTDGTITIFSTATRRANATTGIVTRERREVPLVAGRFRTGALDPGRTTVELVAPGVFESWTFDLPTDGTVSLADMIENSEEYRPSSAVVNAAQAAAAQAELRRSVRRGLSLARSALGMRLWLRRPRCSALWTVLWRWCAASSLT